MGDLTRIDVAQPIEVTDGLSVSAAVKTSDPSGSDGGLVVRNLPSGTQTVALGTGATGTGSLTANGQSVSHALSGASSVTVLITGTWTATVDFEQSSDGGTTWITSLVYDMSGAIYNQATANGTFYWSALSGTTHVRVRSTAFTSGTVNLAYRSTYQDTGYKFTYARQGASNPSDPWYVYAYGVYTEDAAAGDGFQGMPVFGVRNDAAAAVTSTDGDWTAFSADSAGRLLVTGQVAHDAVDAGNPLKVGGQARTTNPAAVADGDRVNAMFDKLGRQVVVNQQCRDLVTTNNITLTGTTETTLLAAGGAGVFHDVTMLVMSNSSGTAVRVDIRDTTGGTVLLSMFLAANGGGAVMPFQPPMNQAAANTNWTAQLSAAVTDVRIKVVAVKNL